MDNGGTFRRLTVVALVVATVASCAREGHKRPEIDASSRRATRSGEVVGFVGQYGSHVWLGLPFAKPPVGALRWRAPQPPTQWTGVREAVAFGPVCSQFGSALGGVEGARPGEPIGSEDCLYLNVYAPRFKQSEVPAGDRRLPVMVWIHGGGNSIGQGGFYDGGNLAATEKVIVITLNYRLGPFGWFRNAALRGNGSNELDDSGNFGTLDLVRALQWVQENISVFGGNPGNVTIFGESAGGTNVFTLLLSPQAHGLFHRAIVESGGLRMSTTAEGENFADDTDPGEANSSNEVLLRFLIKDGAHDRATARSRLAAMSPDEVAHYLRAKSSFDILRAYGSIPRMGMIDMPKVFGDGVVLPKEDPMQSFTRADGYNRVPVILGTNRDENKLFMFNDPQRVRRLLWIFPRLRHPRRYNLTAEYLAKMWKATGADEPAAEMRTTQGPSVFVYRFDWDEEPTRLGADLSVMLGAAHAFEIPFVFGHFDLGKQGNIIFTRANEPSRKTLASQMMSYWAEFAYTGSPGSGRGGRLPAWTAWDNGDPKSPKFLVFDTAAGGGVRMSPNAVTQASVLAAVDDDRRLATQKDKCMIFRELANWSRGFTKKDYPTAGNQGCKDYPFDQYPWSD